jgi:hypothetical protein
MTEIDGEIPFPEQKPPVMLFWHPSTRNCVVPCFTVAGIFSHAVSAARMRKKISFFQFFFVIYISFISGGTSELPEN